MSLFRPEALLHQQGTWLGNLQLTQPLALRWITLGAVLSVVAVAAFLVVGEASRKVHLAGVLVPAQGLVRVAAPRVAGVAQVRVHEGQTVHAGDLLATLNWQEPQLNPTAQRDLHDTLAARLRSLDDSIQRNEQLAADQARTLTQRILSLRQELAQADEQLRWQSQRLTLAEQAQARWESLAQQQFVSTAQVQTQKEAVLALQADRLASTRQRQALLGQLASLEAEQRELPLQTAQRRGELARQHDEVAETLSRADPRATRQELLIQAPVAGQVGTVHVVAGQAVLEGQGLVSLLPLAADGSSALWAQLFAPSSAVGFLSPGQTVQLRLQAFPFQKFGPLPGRIQEVALAPTPVTELPWLVRGGDAGAAAEPLYRVTVQLARQTLLAAGQERALMAGMQLDADVLLERRKLVEWLFEPMLGWRANREGAR